MQRYFTPIKNNNSNFLEYKIVFINNPAYSIAKIRYETYGPNGPGWNVRCSEIDEDLERSIRSKFIKEGRQFNLIAALSLIEEAFSELT